MRYLTVLFDQQCALCRRARSWLEVEPQYVQLRFVAAGSTTARHQFPDLDVASTLRDLTVISDEADVYRGAKAWLMCLWALREYRGLALDWASPVRMILARRFVAWISNHRQALSRPWQPSAVPSVEIPRPAEPRH